MERRGAVAACETAAVYPKECCPLPRECGLSEGGCQLKMTTLLLLLEAACSHARQASRCLCAPLTLSAG